MVQIYNKKILQKNKFYFFCYIYYKMNTMENKKTPQQKYYEANKEKISAQRKARYDANKDFFKKKYEVNKEKIKNYYNENKEKIITNQKNNKEQHNKSTAKYYENNKEKISKQRKEHYEKNKEKIIEANKKYVYKQLDENPLYKFRHNVRSLIRNSIKKRGGKKKLTKTEIILGCTFDEFRTYIESKFEPWMTWDNYGNPKDRIYQPNKTWDFDHIIPVTQGMDELEILKLNHHTNIQPLCSYNNRWVKKDN